MLYFWVLLFSETRFGMCSAVAVSVINMPKEMSFFSELWAALCGSQELGGELLHWIDLDRWNGWTKGKLLPKKKKKKTKWDLQAFSGISVHLSWPKHICSVWCNSSPGYSQAAPTFPPQILPSLRAPGVQAAAGWPFSLPKCLEEPSVSSATAERCSWGMQRF